MSGLTDDVKKTGFKGEVFDDSKTIATYSHDASMFEIAPKLVVWPKDGKDVEVLTKFVKSNQRKYPYLSITARSAGTDMSGGAINDSIIMDFSKHFTSIEKITKTSIQTQPGVLYRDFDEISRAHGTLLPTYPASRDLCSVGGMVNNNSGGEKSIEFGKTDRFTKSLKFVFADGLERVVKPLNRTELIKKMAQKDFEGKVYKQLFELIEDNYDMIQAAKPKVTKDSTGYHLWDVWDRKTGVFDLTKLIVGGQGTLGLVTDITFKVVPARPESGLLVLFMRDIDKLGEVIETVLKHKPSRFESFDDQTLWLSIKFMPSFLKILGWKKFIHLIVTLIPDGLQLLKGMPKLVLMISFKGRNEADIRKKIHALHLELAQHRAMYEINGFEELPTEASAEKFWTMRRYSFQLLRSKVKDKHTAPFIDDLVVDPKYLPEFLPRIRKIIKKYKLFATIAGHMGDGNFHIIPLMKLEDPKDRRKILPAMKEVNQLVLKYKGSLSGEHNDGLVRGPWLEQMYGPHMLEIFKKTKHILDPDNIFNPHKKADATWDYSYSHIRENFDAK